MYGNARNGKIRNFALHLERLEDRYLMNGDPAPVEAIIQPAEPVIDIDTVRVGLPGIIDWMPYVGHPLPEQPVSDPLFESVDQIPAWLIDEIDSRFGELFGTTQTNQYYHWYNHVYLRGDATLLNTAANFDASAANVQVAGVDEADLIETDGEFIYVISGDELIIIDARDSENLSISSRVQLSETPTGMYLAGNRLTLVSSDDWYASSLFMPRMGLMLADVAYGGWNAYQPKTTVTVLDVTDRAAPTQVQKTELDGRLVSSRMVDGQLRLILQQNSVNLLDYLPSINTVSSVYDEGTQTTTYSYETREAYLARVQQTLSKSIVPTYRTFDLSGAVVKEELLVALEAVVRSGHNDNGTATTIATFDTLGDVAGPTATKTIYTADAAVVYATQDSLYVLGRDWENSNRWQDTTIWKFSFDDEDHSIELAAKGTVVGYLLNQFSVDEHEGYLRIVTSEVWGGGQSLNVLQQVGAELKVVGSVTGLAPGENVYSVRFAGDRAYVVTFRRVDPLFSIDLSDPTNPEVEGELKIPGYSDYLQSIDENHLIGVGRGASETTGLFEELQISIFNVTDLSDPELLHRYSFGGGRETTTPVTGNQWATGDGDHLAFNYFADEQIVAIPVENMAGKSGLQVLRVDMATGFESLALIEHGSPILRSLRFDDKLVVISAGTITVHSFADPVTVLEELDFAAGTDSEFTTLSPYLNLALRAAEGTHVFGDGSWMAGLSLSTVASQLPFQDGDSRTQDFDYLFAEQSVAYLDAAQPTSSRDRAFDSFFVPVSRSVRASVEDVAGELVMEFAEAVEE